MGTSYQIVCEDCKEYIYMNKVRLATHWLLSTQLTYDDISQIDVEDWNHLDSMFIRSVLYFLIFQREHYGHHVKIVTEFDRIWDIPQGGGFYGNANELGFREIYKPTLYDDETEPAVLISTEMD